MDRLDKVIVSLLKVYLFIDMIKNIYIKKRFKKMPPGRGFSCWTVILSQTVVADS